MRAPPAQWTGRRWTLALLLACLGMVGPFSTDAYLPAFAAIGADLQAGPLPLQQTLSVYLLALALMNLFHGAIADSVGRRPVVLTGVAVYTAASIGCALADSVGMLLVCRALQGASAGAGMVVTRALVRDLYPPHEVQRLMSRVTLFFGIAPALAPLIGGLCVDHIGWRAIFWLLAAWGLLLWLTMLQRLPETLPPAARQPFGAMPLLRGYRTLARNAVFVALVLASGLPFSAMFLYVLAAPAFLGQLLGLPPAQYFVFFLFTVGGMVTGAWQAGRRAGRVPPRQQVRLGFGIAMGAVAVNVLINLVTVLAGRALPPWAAMLPVGVFAFGWSQLSPAVSVLALDVLPSRRGMASSLQSSFGSAANALVAGLVVPLAMGSLLSLALAQALLLGAGLAAWAWVAGRLPQALATPQPAEADPATPSPSAV